MTLIVPEDHIVGASDPMPENLPSPAQVAQKSQRQYDHAAPAQAASKFHSTVLFFGIACMFFGAVAYFAGASTASDYLLAAGLLTYIGIKLGTWWERR